MPQQHEREPSSTQEDENESANDGAHGSKSESAEKASEKADKFLEEIDQVLEETLGIRDMDERERNRLADKWVKDYIQKGGE